MILDAKASRVRIQTFAEGLFSKLAHDLELVLEDLSGSVENDTAVIEAPIESIRVAGVLKGDRVDPSVLSPNDERDILQKMRREVFQAERGVVRVEATRESIRLHFPNGRGASLPAPAIEASDSRVATTGSFELATSSIGAKVVKGPMGAFRVKDRVLVRYEIVFQPA